MALPGNGIFIVKGEISILISAMRRGARWSSHSHQDDDVDELMKSFQDLKDILYKTEDLRLIEPHMYLTPFLNVIKSEETTGPVTSLALLAINKFLSYGLISGIIDIRHSAVPLIVHNIADAVTHARFVGTDQSSDGVVLMRILQVLRTLTLAPEGATLTNESLCEIMLSCFRICFETRLNELLRRTAEHYLKDMVQLVFMRLPQFSEDLHSFAIKQFKMRPGAIDQPRSKRRSRSFRSKNKQIENRNNDKNLENEDHQSPSVLKPQANHLRGDHLSTTPVTPGSNIVDMQGSISQHTPNTMLSESNDNTSSPSNFPENDTALPQCNIEITIQSPTSLEEKVNEENNDVNKIEEVDRLITFKTRENDKIIEAPMEMESSKSAEQGDTVEANQNYSELNQEYVNQRGIRFTPQSEDNVPLVPYGIACVKELFRFLISLCNPLDKQNTDVMIHLGLTLLTVAFEVGADSIGKYPSLLSLVKDDLCRNLFSLLNTERLSVFAADLQVSFLMFESLRTHLKFQLELYLTKLIEIIVSESLKVTYEHKEIALDNILQLWRIPGFVTELYLNYDCDMYCTNLYEDLTKLLAKNAFSATTGVYHTHLLSLDALLTVIESIEDHCKECKLDQSIDVTTGNLEGSNDIDNFVGKLSRIKISENVPPKEVLLERKNIKKWLPTGTEHFNHKPKKGIQFFQEHGILKQDFDAHEVALFLRENPMLDKKVIGEYIGNRNNLHILDAFVKTFDFNDMRIDEALRNYLETFRLPGEAPTISLLLEHFAEHWHKSNGEPFADVDSAFTLAYAVIMLNVDQHNQNAKKQSVPMTARSFKRNVAGVNGGADFDEDMLDEMYNTIKNDEIVMPAEQTGVVRENYLWKVLIRKGASKDGEYFHVNNNPYDSELFSLIWGPVLAALSFVFDRSEEPIVYKRAVGGFENCAFISSHYNMTANLDMLVLTLCKFTGFHNQRQNNNNVSQFGGNVKAQLALKTVFDMCHQHGDNIREGWKNIFDLILSLYVHNMLPKMYVEAEDFIDSSGKIALIYKEVENSQKQDTSLFSSLYSYMVSSENLTKIPTAEEQEYIDLAKICIKECNLEQLVADSKFLHDDSLSEMIRALVELSKGPDVQKSLGYNYNENVAIFFLELLLRVVIQNRDRVMTIWNLVRDHLYTLVMNASLFDYQFLLERSVIGLLRVAIRLMRNEDMSPIVLQSLRMLLLLKSSTLCRISRQISFGLYELLKTSAQNIHTNTDWTIVFTLLECVGAGAQPPKPIVDDNHVDQATKSDGEAAVSDEEVTSTDRGYTSDSELSKSPRSQSTRSQSPIVISPSSPANNSGGWILVGNEGEVQPVVGRTVPPNQYNLALERNLGSHDPSSLIKCCESLAFLVRDVAHITPYNFDVCVHCIRTFVEASLHGSNRNRKNSNRSRRKPSRRRAHAYNSKRSPVHSQDEDDSSDEEDLPSGYHQISIQLLDLMHTLHTRTAQIYRWWAEEAGDISEEVSLWTHGWCPLLQGIARLCCDIRKQVRMGALTYLQRALLVHDLQTLNGPEWEACFHRVLFPLLLYLLQPINSKDPLAMEETRMRAATLLSKVFLHHLTPLLSLPTFNGLWLIILDFMDKYMNADKSDLLYEAIPESLKNMLLVMDSANVFDDQEGKNQLWIATWTRIDQFLPYMRDELFREVHPEMSIEEVQQQLISEEKEPLSQVQAVQHNVENATRSSIILQPPSSQQPISSHLFAHLGQMVSTPIGGPSVATELPSHNTSQLPQVVTQNTIPHPIIPNSTTPILQPTLQPGMPYMPNLFNSTNQPHTFPVLYNNPIVPSTKPPTEVQPVSLYAEYMGNPYNVTPVEKFQKLPPSAVITDSEPVKTDNSAALAFREVNEESAVQLASCRDDENASINNNDINENKDEERDDTIRNNNFFQSSNYFGSKIDANLIPPGSEILFGNQVVNSPSLCVNSSLKTSDT